MGQVGSWHERIVASMCVSKRAGYTFDSAWGIALQRNRPSGRDVIAPEGERLFNESGEQEESVVDAMYRFCGDAWHGRRPGLRGFSLDLFRATEPDGHKDWRSIHRLAA